MINVNNVFKYFGDTQVLKGVSCNIEKGEKVDPFPPVEADNTSDDSDDDDEDGGEA